MNALLGPLLGGLLAAGATFRRVVALRHLVLAVLGGLLAGAALWGLPAPGLLRPVGSALVTGLAALLVLPICAALPAGDRAGGYERLVGLRPVTSAGLALGRIAGSLAGAALLLLILSRVAEGVASERPVPHEIRGSSLALAGERPEWRFSVPATQAGPFELGLTLLPRGPGLVTLVLELRRGNASTHVEQTLPAARRIVLGLPELADGAGDVYVRLLSREGAAASSEAPVLRAGSERLGDLGLALSREQALRLAMAVLAAVAAACAFHFETALLAGLLALVAPSQPGPVLLAVMAGLLLAFAVLGTALVRRQALP